MDAQTFNSEKMRWLNSMSEGGKVSATAFLIAYRIANYLNKVSGDAWPSYQTLAKEVSRSTKSVQRAVGELKGAGWLIVKGSYKRSNRYRIAWPPGSVQNAQSRKRAGDKNALDSGQVCRKAEDEDVPQSYLRNLSRTYLRRPGEVSRTGRPFPDRGKWESKIIGRFGPSTEKVLEELQEINPSALDELCHAEREGRLTEGRFQSARLGVLEMTQRRSI